MFGTIKQEKRPLDFSSNPDQWSNGAGDGRPTERKRKRRSRWGAEEPTEKTVIPGMPTVLPSNLDSTQERQYLLHLQIEEISRRLRSGDLGIPANPEDRSPSPEPIYNNEGKRLNTREYRTRRKLEEERHMLVQEAQSLNTDYKAPADYKPPVIRVNDKVMIPQEAHPDINFVGLLIGPRGNTLKTLEKETGAKIIIRGKGSVKDGKIGRKDGQPLPGEDEPLHAYVTANNPENVKKAVEKINGIIREGVEVPEGQNDLRRQQLRELALLNGTLRENDGLAKLKQLQQAQTIVTNTILCANCGGTGHIAKDCKQLRPGDSIRMIQRETPSDRAKMDSEYMSLMAELGQGPPPSKQDNMMPQQRHTHQPAHHFHQSRFNQPPPNPMTNNPPYPRMSQPPPALMSIGTTPPRTQLGGPAHHSMPQPLMAQNPSPVGLPPPLQHQQLQQVPPLQPQGLTSIQQSLQNLAGQQQQQQQQQQQAATPQPVAPPTITSQFQPFQATFPTQLAAISAPGLAPMSNPAPVAAPVPPPSTSVLSSSHAQPVPAPAPWQTSFSPSPFTQVSSSTSRAVAPPQTTIVMSAPPPPPSTQQTPGVQGGIQWVQQQTVVPPPPPPSSQAAPVWQPQSAAPPPPPAVVMSQMSWQQAQQQQQQQQQVVQAPVQSMPNPVAPPPPPPSSGQGYGMPPPPPGGFDVNQISGVNQLLVAPPPPPPN